MESSSSQLKEEKLKVAKLAGFQMEYWNHLENCCLLMTNSQNYSMSEYQEEERISIWVWNHLECSLEVAVLPLLLLVWTLAIKINPVVVVAAKLEEDQCQPEASLQVEDPVYLLWFEKAQKVPIMLVEVRKNLLF